MLSVSEQAIGGLDKGTGQSLQIPATALLDFSLALSQASEEGSYLSAQTRTVAPSSSSS